MDSTGKGRLLAWLRGTTGRRRHRVFRARRLVQGFFTAVTLFVGYRFAVFINAARDGAASIPERPPGVEAFLPISGLMGVLDAFHQGGLNRIHPAASVLVVLFLVMALLLRKAFCSWVCPVGLLSDGLAVLGRKLAGRNFRPIRWVDFPLRGLKHALLFFFVGSILAMSPEALVAFIDSPYNRVADVKMYFFFARLGATGAWVIAALALASVFVTGVWCRYLCPYGALLGYFSVLSPLRIRRSAMTCTSCGLCDAACMARIPISGKPGIISQECTGCYDCIAVCPVPGTLTMGTRKRSASVAAFAAAVVLVFAVGYGGARVAGIWKNDISDAEYGERIREIDDPAYGHPGGSGEVEGESGRRQSSVSPCPRPSP
ncbi:MAG: (4Fe-4S)-binding protein [Gemmatimonadetes bacterium]|jgi:ferredoxin|nr:(4Fe-4S)-binding protein [Gemmatimonadota bacterium]